MPAAPVATKPLCLICGDDEFAVKERAKEVFKKWTTEIGGSDHETIDAAVSNAGDALRALAKLREAIQTLPFFGGGKVVWLQNCNFLGEERAAAAKDVTETLADLSAELKTFDFGSVRLLISAGKVDKRKTFYKTLEKIGSVELFDGLSIDDKDWAAEAESMAFRILRAVKKEITNEAVAKLVANVGPNARQLHSECEKLALYVGDRPEIDIADVDTIVTKNKQARAFALGDALGDRDLPQLLKRLDEELWEVRRDPQKSEIGLLYGLISKIRTMILAKELMAQGWLKPARDFNSFRPQLARIPADQMPEDKKFNPLSINPYVLFRASMQASKYTSAELVRAMDILLDANQKLVSRSLDETLVLQHALVQILHRP